MPRFRRADSFQSTRPHGARPGYDGRADRQVEFQSTRPHGARPVSVSLRVAEDDVSIHAPAWGATIPDGAILKVKIPFQSTRPHGARQDCPRSFLCAAMFQSTRPHGARLSLPIRYSGNCKFQSTRPHGARLKALRPTQLQESVSIHAPAWGATLDADKLRRLTTVSIHAPAWGATVASVAGTPGCPVSIHAPAWGATFTTSRIRSNFSGFNPRARMGRDTSG